GSSNKCSTCCGSMNSLMRQLALSHAVAWCSRPGQATPERRVSALRFPLSAQQAASATPAPASPSAPSPPSPESDSIRQSLSPSADARADEFFARRENRLPELDA